MKRSKVLIAAVLLLAVLLSGFGPAMSGHVTPTKASGAIFGIKFEGDKVEGSGEAVNGVYHVEATKTDGESWHVKLECNYPTVAGHEYHVTYRFNSSVAGKVKFGDFQEFTIVKGENEVSGLVIAKDATSYLDLQLGMLQPFTMDFSQVEILEVQDEMEYEDALPQPIRFDEEDAFYERHDQGYSPDFTRTEDSVTVNYYTTGWDTAVWKSRLYVNTGFVPQPGNRYRISADLNCEKDMDYEVLLNRDDLEKGYGALYGRHLTGGQPATVETLLTIPASGFADGELVVQFSLGSAPEETDVTISNLRVEKVNDKYTNLLPAGFALDKEIYSGKNRTTVSVSDNQDVALDRFSYSGLDSVYKTNDDDYTATLTETATNATLAITQAPASGRGVWKARLFAQTGVTLEPGVTYRIKYDLYSQNDQAKYEVCFKGDTDEAYGSDKSRSLTAGATDHVEYMVTPDASHGPLTILLQLGETDTPAGNTVTLSNVSVEKVTASFADVGTADFDSGATADFYANEAYIGGDKGATVSQDGGSASITIKQPPATGRESWKVKFFVNSIAALTAGKRYRVSVDVVSTADVDYEICYNSDVNGGGEKGVKAVGGGEGAQYGLKATTASQTVTFDLAPESDATLSLQFNLGLADTANTTVTVSNLKVQEVTSADTALTLTGFTYPTTTHHDAVYTAKTYTLSQREKMAYDGSAATLAINADGAVLDITAPHGDGGAVWSTGMKLNTGFTPESGKTYRVSAAVSATDADNLGEFNVVCRNNYGDPEYSGKWGLSGAQTLVFDFTVTRAAAECGEMYMAFEFGNSAVNTITVSGITIQEMTAAGYDETTAGSFSTVPGDDPAEKAALTGDGTSATATVTAASGTDDWKLKMYVNTGVTLTSGKNYRIDMTVGGTGGGWTVDYKRTGGDGEDEFKGTMSFGPTVSNTVTPTQTGNLEIVLKLGKVAVGDTVTVSGVTVTELGAENLGENMAVAPTVGCWAHTDYGKPDAGAVTASGSTASLEIKYPPANPDDRADWKVKFFVNTNIDLTAGKMYRISADVSSTAPVDYDIAYNNDVNGGGENAVGHKGSWDNRLHADSAVQTVVYDVNCPVDGKLGLQLNVGLAAEQCTVTVSNVKVEESLGETVENLLPSFAYDAVGSFSFAADNGYNATLTRAASYDTFTIHSAPDDRNPWNAKLYVNTGFTPEQGQAYLVSFDLASAKPQGTFEVFYDGDKEEAYGQKFGPSLSAGSIAVSQIIYPGDSKGVLTLQLRFGKTDGTDGNSYTVSNVKVQKVKLNYNTVTELEDTSALWSHDTYTAALSRTAKQASVRITKTPNSGLEPWKTKLFVPTGVRLLPGLKYRVSVEVFSNGYTPYEITLNKEGEEKGFGAYYGLTATPEPQKVEYIFYASREGYLTLQFSLGAASAPTTFTISNLQVERAGKTSEVSDTIYTF